MDEPIRCSHRSLIRSVCDVENPCTATIREVLGYLEPVSTRRVRWVRLMVCDLCDVAIECWWNDKGWLEFRRTYPYRPNLRIGRRKRRGQ